MLGVIFARALDGAMGKDGTLPWHVPEDMALFRTVTTGHPVLMGRRTWESIDAAYRPLPHRENYVISRNSDYEAPGATVCASLMDAYTRAQGDNPETLVWLIGGAELIGEALTSGLAQAAMVTDLNIDVPGADTFAPMLDFSWEIASTTPSRGWHLSRSGIEYRFSFYRVPESSLIVDLPAFMLSL